MTAVELVAGLCRRFEGCRLLPYLCPAGVPTIGYGATYYDNGVHVTLQDPAITEEYAEELLKWHIENVYLKAVVKLCPNIKDPSRLAAIVDFAYNLGATNLKTSTLRKRILAENWEDVPAQLMRWVRAGGRILRGLVIRRKAESDLI
jgi:lysozyme